MDPAPQGNLTPLAPGGCTEWLLDYINIENFKSYKNVTSIGPLRQFPFIAIIGPNGSGKSNLMDAISFVLGERATTLRVRRHDELIHGASIGKPVSSSARVTAVFKHMNEGSRNPNQNEKTFSRVIRGTSSEYLYNGQVVSQQIYLDQLKYLGINAKGKNFLVFQGAIESIALKNSKERTVLLEEICGTIAMKNEYEEAKTRQAVAEKKMEAAHMLRKAILLEKKEAKMEIQEAKNYNEILSALAEKETEIALFKFYHIGNKLENLNGEQYQTNKAATLLEKAREKLDTQLQKKKKEQGELYREWFMQETLMQKMEKQRNKKMPKSIEINQRRKHQENKLQCAEKSLKHAETSKLNHEKDIAELRGNLNNIEMEYHSFLQLQNDTQIAEGLDVTLRDSQMREYWDLKQEVLKKTLKEKTKMEKLEQQKMDKDDVFNSLNRDKIKLEGDLDITNHAIKAEHKLVHTVTENIDELKTLMQSKEDQVIPLRRQFHDAESKIDDLQQQLNNISVEIDLTKSDRHEVKRQKNKFEVITTLKNHFSGVFNRVTNLCRPVHPKYTTAITKVIGKNMEAIVVDSEKTARHCIQYLKEQMIEPEVFLPLDLLHVKPLKTSLRKKKDLWLAYDVLQFDKTLERAILHCTKSTAICSTSELASKVASGEYGSEPTNAVSLDGTMYRTNGVISGGIIDLQKKARRWDDETLNQMLEQKSKIQDGLREAFKTTRNALSLQCLEQDILGIKKRLEYANVDLKTHIKKASQHEAEKERLESALKQHVYAWDNAKAEVSDLAGKLKKFVGQINVTEDQVFSSFCEQIGIPNIRAYEERDVRAQEEFNREKQHFENKRQEIQLQIDYEENQQQTLVDNVYRWEESVYAMKEMLECYKVDVKKIACEMSVIEGDILNVKKELERLKLAMDSKTKDLAETNKNLVDNHTLLMKKQKERNYIDNQMYQLKIRRHEFYKDCKNSGTTLTFVQGSLDDIYVGPRSESSAILTQDVLQIENQIQVDFQKLSVELKSLSGTAVDEAEEKLNDELNEIEKKIELFQAPNLEADGKWENLNNKARQHQAEFDEIREEVQEARKAFHEIKKDRHNKFMTCYEKISQNIDIIYKDLTQNQSAQAILGLDNPDEPYLDGVSYHCIAPGKRFQSMNNLSGGEKTLAALALLFAIHSYEPTPFFVLDEIDAALDNTNIGKVTSYIRKKSKELQVLVISLKEDFFENADALVGIAPDVEQTECICSKTYTLDLTKYKAEM